MCITPVSNSSFADHSFAFLFFNAVATLFRCHSVYLIVIDENHIAVSYSYIQTDHGRFSTCSVQSASKKEIQ